MSPSSCCCFLLRHSKGPHLVSCHGRRPERALVLLQTEYAEHSIVEAQRMLLRAALEDESNIKFAVLSESCMPLYPPTMLYLQLLSETRSRVNTSPEGVSNPGPLSHAMQIALFHSRQGRGRQPSSQSIP